MSDLPPVVFTENNLKAIKILVESKKAVDEIAINLLTQSITLNSQYAEAYTMRANRYKSVNLCYKSALDMQAWFNFTIPSDFRGSHCASYIYHLRDVACQLSREEIKELEAIEHQANLSRRMLAEKTQIWRDKREDGPPPSQPGHWQEAIWLHRHGDYRNACLEFASIGGQLSDLHREYIYKYKHAYEKTGAPQFYS